MWQCVQPRIDPFCASLPGTLAHQQWMQVVVFNCNDSVTPFGGIPPSAPYWIFVR